MAIYMPCQRRISRMRMEVVLRKVTPLVEVAEVSPHPDRLGR